MFIDFNLVDGIGYCLAGQAICGLPLSDQKDSNTHGFHEALLEEDSLTILPKVDTGEVVVGG